LNKKCDLHKILIEKPTYIKFWSKNPTHIKVLPKNPTQIKVLPKNSTHIKNFGQKIRLTSKFYRKIRPTLKILAKKSDPHQILTKKFDWKNPNSKISVTSNSITFCWTRKAMYTWQTSACARRKRTEKTEWLQRFVVRRWVF
jgi:hypothetical protein